MPLVQNILSTPSSSPLAAFAIGLAVLVLPILYRLYFHPLSHIPGPLFARITSLYLYTISYRGVESTVLAHHHQRYKTSVLRIAPNAVSVSDGGALHQIYVAGGGFQKDPCYENFNLDGHATIFSTLDTGYRAVRAKVVVPLFAMGRVRAAGVDQGAMKQCVDKFIERFKADKTAALDRGREASSVNLLDLAGRLAIDVVTGYLYNKRYGGLDEAPLDPAQDFATQDTAKEPIVMSVMPFVSTIVAFGRFFLLPNSIFLTLDFVFGRVFADSKVNESFDCVQSYTTNLVNDVDTEKDDTYQSRLLAVGISKAETIAQCKDLMFAGTDSTATSLVTTLFHLVRNPEVLDRLKREITEYGDDPNTDPQTLPFLRAVIREGLRLAMANPTRLPRIVSPSGLQVGGYLIPAGTSVGVSTYMLHHDSEVFSRPFEFRPGRWLDEAEPTNDTHDAKAEQHRKERERDFFPFGIGSRGCIARNLATHELFMAVRAVVESGVLEGAKTQKERIEIDEWFNSRIKGGKVEVAWPD